MGKIDVVQEGWISKKDFNIFTSSANNQSVSGILNARHAKNYEDPPKDTMTLEHGEEVVKGILRIGNRSY